MDVWSKFTAIAILFVAAAVVGFLDTGSLCPVLVVGLALVGVAAVAKGLSG